MLLDDKYMQMSYTYTIGMITDSVLLYTISDIGLQAPWLGYWKWTALLLQNQSNQYLNCVTIF